jgi:hypothetical protein
MPQKLSRPYVVVLNVCSYVESYLWKRLIHYLAIKPFAGTILESVTESETDSETESETESESKTESESNSDSESNSESESKSKSVSVDNVEEANSSGATVRKSRVAKKELIDEVWVGTNYFTHIPLMSCQQPRWSEEPSSSSKARNHVLVRNRIIEISDTDDSSADTSPTPQAGPAIKTGSISFNDRFLY